MDNFKNLNELLSILNEGEKYDLNLSELITKLKKFMSSQSIGTIKIVLLGSFSDGKTTAIAGLLGKLESNMKIDEDESSDELSVYHLEGLGHEFEIVDTPGLFGTKEKEVDGKNVRFSEITEKYISEAHIIIYVCNSVNTLKDSHKDIIRKVLRDYGKLKSTIFVINKMDEVADTLDEEEYADVSEIKRSTFVQRLKQVIGLTPDEEKSLNIACIAANPKGKGLNVWFDKKEEYKRRSHIAQLDTCVRNVVANSNINQLKSDTNVAVTKDLMSLLYQHVFVASKDATEVCAEVSDSVKTMEGDLAILKSDIIQNKGIMTNRLNDQKKRYIESINSAGSLTAIGSFLETELGMQDGKIDFNILQRESNQIMSECAESTMSAIQTRATAFDREFAHQNAVMDDLLKKGVQGLGKVKISNTHILKARDLFFKGHKFKPWGAKNLAGKLTKGFGYAAVGLGILMDAYSIWKKYSDAKKLDQMKNDLKDALNDIFKQIFECFNSDEKFYENFAPSYVELVDALSERQKQLADLSDKVSELNSYKTRLNQWYGSDIEDAVFEEIK